MPRRSKAARNSTRSKNARRVQSAETALARVNLSASANKPKRKRNKDRGRNDFLRYCSSVLADYPLAGVDLPGFGFGGRYSTVNLVTRTNLSSGLGVEASVVVNPYTAIFTSQLVERTNAGGQITNIANAVMMNSTNTPIGSMPGGDSTQFVALTFANAFLATGNTRFSGWVRPRFCHFRLIYTGTELNKGGQVQFFHNPAQRAMCCYRDSAIDGASALGTSYTSVSAIAQDTENVIPHYMGDSLEFTWRPATYEFQNIDSYIEIPSGSPLNLMNAQFDKYAPEVDTPTAPTICGHQTGFRLQPAAGAASSVLNYELEIRMEVDVVLNLTTSTTATTTAIPGTKVAVSHPLKEAMLKNATSQLHAARSSRTIPHRSQRSGLVPAAAEAAVTGIAQELGSSIASKLPSLF